MDLAARIEECCLAPVGSALLAHDTRVIERDGWYQTITPSSGSTVGNEIVVSRVAEAEIESLIDAAIAEYRRAGVPFKWCVHPLTEPADMGERLARRGFTSWDVRGMAIAPGAWRGGARVPGVIVEPVTEAMLDEYRACWSEGWEMPVGDAAEWNAMHVRAFATGRFRMFLARVDGEAAGTCGVIARPRSLYLVGGNVLPRFRGRGLYRAMLDARLHDATSLAVTQAREATSAPMLEHLGFETLFRSRIYRSP